jgi:2-deoxy-D-gluconate 3-dehydrogenase
VSWLEQFQLHGKTALVTGCRRGIGAGMAHALAEAGADIVGVSAHLEPSGSEVQSLVEGCGRRFKGYACDLGNRSAVHEFIAVVKEREPSIDILINNAGIIRRTPAANHSDTDWDDVLEVNLSAQFVLAREFGKSMIENGDGKIVFTASILSFQGGITVPGYAASKGAIAQLTMALANEWAGSGVNVNAIAPGYIRTDNTQALQDDEERFRQILTRIPAGRWGTTDDLKGAVVFLSSPASAYVNGITLVVDGGWMGR